MKLTIAGRLGSGKTTIASILKEERHFETYSIGKIQRDLAERMGLSIYEFSELCKGDCSYDSMTDDEMFRIYHKAKDQNVIFDSRMAWHLLKDTYNIYTVVDPLVSTERILNSDRGKTESYNSFEEASIKLSKRTQAERERYQSLYNVDIFNLENYDLVVDTTWCTPGVIADKIYELASSGKGNKTRLLLSPKSLFPTAKHSQLRMPVVNEYRLKLENNEPINPIKVVYHEGYFYILHGHHKVIASLIQGCDFIEAEFIHLHDFSQLKEEVSHAGLSTLHDYEEVGNFRYKSYPNLYK